MFTLFFRVACNVLLGANFVIFQPKKSRLVLLYSCKKNSNFLRLQELKKKGEKNAWSVGVISMLLHKTCEFIFSLVQPCTRYGKLSHHQTRNCEQLCFEIVKFLNREITFSFGQ
jgi:hypothetical protein